MAFSVFFFPHLALTSRLENMMQSPHLQFFGAIIRTKFQFFPETRVDLFSQFLGEDPALTHQIQNPPRKTSWVPGFKIQDLSPWIQEFFLGILNLESWDSRSFSGNLESWILNPIPLDSRSFSGNLESWILNPIPLDSRSFSGNLESWILNPDQERLQAFANVCKYFL